MFRWWAASRCTRLCAVSAVPTQLVVYPGQFHGITRPSYQKDRMERYSGLVREVFEGGRAGGGQRGTVGGALPGCQADSLPDQAVANRRAG